MHQAGGLHLKGCRDTQILAALQNNVCIHVFPIKKPNSMKKELEAGMAHTETKRVEPSDTAATYGSGTLQVFATPAMIAFMENTAMKAVLPYLPDGYDTVGFEVNMRHLKPSPVGEQVACKTVLSEVAEKKLVFEVEVHDGSGVIGKGSHTRYIINKEKFMSNL
jgi:predicted thioesterase